MGRTVEDPLASKKKAKKKNKTSKKQGSTSKRDKQPTGGWTADTIITIVLVVVLMGATFRKFRNMNLEDCLPTSGGDNVETTAIINSTTTAAVVAQQRKLQQQMPNLPKDRLDYYKTHFKYQTPVVVPSDASNNAPFCGPGPDYGDFFGLGRRERSARLNEDRIIYEKLFKHRGPPFDPGTYVELGSYNGAEGSLTRFFDVCLGWKGLVIDANPTPYERMLEQNKRPSAHAMLYSPSCLATGTTVQVYTGDNPSAGIEGLAPRARGATTASIPCGPLTPVLQDVFEKQRINLITMDVMGAELQILQTLDFAKVQVDVWVVNENHAECATIFEKHGYKRHLEVIPGSDLYIHSSSKYQL